MAAAMRAVTQHRTTQPKRMTGGESAEAADSESSVPPLAAPGKGCRGWSSPASVSAVSLALVVGGWRMATDVARADSFVLFVGTTPTALEATPSAAYVRVDVSELGGVVARDVGTDGGG